jgi:hypothetical protein
VAAVGDGSSDHVLASCCQLPAASCRC